MKINKDYANSIYDNVLPVTEWQAAEFTYDGSAYSTESLISYVAHSLSHSASSPLESNWKGMCAYLDAKIVASRKTATYWDAYNVRGTITNVNDFDQSVASLSNSSSYIIDCDAFSRGGVNYTRGDAILKDFYGNLIHIPSTQTGYYLPSAISAVSNSPGVYAITFDYVEGSTRPLSDQHILPIETTEVESGVIYNLLKTLAPGEGYELTLILVDGVIVKPLWEARETSSQEKVFNAISVKYTTSTVVFQNSSQLTVDVIAK